MEILVCVKRVPDTAENEIEVNGDGSDIERDDLVYSVNEWDNYAVEEAIQIRDNVGGSVTVVTVGDDESEEVLRREMAMGADNGLLLCDDAFEGADGKGVATLLKAAVENGNYDLILTGAQADGGAGEVGGMLAAMLDVPYASLVNKIEVDGDKLKVGREIEGGNHAGFGWYGEQDGDGVATPGLYRQSDGFVYVRDSNTEGIADSEFFFGNPGDWPLVGDFDGDGDLDAFLANDGGSSGSSPSNRILLNDGSGLIPAGSLNIGFNGPCPPPGKRYNYEFTVIAVDTDGIIAGFGKKRQPFPPK